MLTPGSEDELAEVLRHASAPLRVQGGGTRVLPGPSPAELLSTAAIAGVVLHEPGALTLVAKAGTALTEIEAVLAREGQRLAFEPPDFRALLGTAGEPTIGGVIAANASGPRRVQAGAARDFLLGVRFVDGAGAVVKNGGRVMKNVTGYDLVKLMAGSRGALGVLTEVALKVLPRPAAMTTLVLPAATPAEAVAALAAALGSPFEVTGAAYLPGTGALLRLEGFADSVAYRSGRLAEYLSPFGTARTERGTEAELLWRALRDVTAFASRPGDVWRVSVKPSDGPEAARRLGGDVVLDWGGGLVWALLPEGTDARARLAGLDGHATLVRAAPATLARLPALPPAAPPVAALNHGLRQRFDPRGLFAGAAA